MNLCCNCYHKNVCEWDVSAYGIDCEFGTKSCEDFRSETDVEMRVKFFNEIIKIWNDCHTAEEFKYLFGQTLLRCIDDK